jgi:hypothetical protein
MDIEFYRDADTVPIARALRADMRALSGLLTSDVGSIDNAMEVLDLLGRAAASGPSVDETGNAYTLQANGSVASVEFAIDGSIRPVHLPTRDLIALIEAWLRFLQRGSPRGWREPGVSPQDVLRPPQ